MTASASPYQTFVEAQEAPFGSMTRTGGIFTSREEAREILTKKIASQKRSQADPRSFSTFDPQWLIDDAEERLRWIDCAPEGANHLAAPLQGKYGVPCGEPVDCNLGPGRALRDAYDKRNGPGSWKLAKIAQHEAKLEREAAR